jgi:tetratricopeptide (TPR) repeat protein
MTEFSDMELFKRAKDLLQQEASPPQLEPVYHQLRENLRQHPKSLPTLRLLAEYAHRQGLRQDTREYLYRAERVDPWNIEVLLVAESIHQTLSNSPAAGIKTLSHLRRNYEAGTVNAERLIEDAKGAYQLGNIERAYILAKLAYCIQPKNTFHIMDILAIGSSIDPERTKDELLFLEKTGRHSAYLYLALGSICNVLGLYDQSTSWLKMGTQLQLDEPIVHAMLKNELAYVTARQGREFELCISLARQALDQFPDKQANGFIRDTLGVAYLKSGQIDKAIQNLQEAVRKDQTIIPRFHLALAFLHEGDAVSALEQLQHIATSKPSMDAPHIEETKIREQVQKSFARIEDLLNLGGADDIRDVLDTLNGLL